MTWHMCSTLTRLLFCVVALSLGWGCSSGVDDGPDAGGTGGGAGGTGGTGGVIVVPPTVTETVPQDMETDVAPDTTVRAQFDAVLDETTVTTNSFSVRRGDGTPVAGNVSVDTAGLIAIFTPDSPLDLSSSFTATLAAGIQSIEGGALDADYSWSFTTRDGAWAAAEPIETGDTDATLPQVVIDASGNATAVWTQLEGPQPRIWANRSTPGAGWGDPSVIGDEGDAGAAQIAVDPQGNAIAVWDESDAMSSNVWANRFTPEAGWNGGQVIEIEMGNAEAAQIAMDLNGRAICVWRQQEGARFDIWANRFVPETGWSDAARIEVNNAGDANYPRLAVAPNGNAIAVWGQSDGTRINIWANRFTPGGGWGNAVLIEQGGGSGRLPDATIDSSGNAIAVWSQTDGARYSIWANRFTPVSGWAGAQLIETDDAGDAGGVEIAAYPGGDAIVVWTQSDGAVTNIWTNHFTRATGWGEAELIENDDAGDADSPQVAVDPKGSAIAVWSQSDGVQRHIWANRFGPGAGWGTPQLIDADDAGDAVTPQIALDPAGSGTAVWSSYDGARSGIWASQFE